MDGWLAKCRLRAKFAGASARGPGCRLADWEICATCAVDSAWRVWRFHNSWRLGEAWTHHGCGDLSGVNGTPLLRGIEFTHAPSQGWIKDVWNGAERQGETLQKSERWIAADDYE